MDVIVVRYIISLAFLVSILLLAHNTVWAFNFKEHHDISCLAVNNVCDSFFKDGAPVALSATTTSSGKAQIKYAREFLCNSLCRAGSENIALLIPEDGDPKGLECGGYGDIVGLVDYFESPLEIMKADCQEMRQAKSDFIIMVKLAHKNDSHFGKNAELTYRLWQKMAITAAAAATGMVGDSRQQGEDIWRKRLVEEALIYSAFAAHFLEDRHSSGHIRVPRQEVSDDVAQRIHDKDSEEGLCLSPNDVKGGLCDCEDNIYGDGHLMDSNENAKKQKEVLFNAVVSHITVLLNTLNSPQQCEPEIYSAILTAPFFHEVSNSPLPVGLYYDRAGYPSLSLRYSNYRGSFAFNYILGVIFEFPLLQAFSLTATYFAGGYWKGTRAFLTETGELTLKGTNGWIAANTLNIGSRLYWRDVVIRSLDLFADVSWSIRNDLFHSWSFGYGGPPDIMGGARLRLWRFPISIQVGYPSRPQPKGAANHLEKFLALDIAAGLTF